MRVLANRLSANPGNRVLVLEADLPEFKFVFRIHMPAALTYTLAGRTYNWWYESDPEPHTNNRRIDQPRGKILGGSSCINGMTYIRGNAMDYEKWSREDGLDEWSYAHCLPYFKRFECRTAGADEYQGAVGPLYLTEPDNAPPLFPAGGMIFFVTIRIGLHIRVDFRSPRPYMPPEYAGFTGGHASREEKA